MKFVGFVYKWRLIFKEFCDQWVLSRATRVTPPIPRVGTARV